MSPSLNYSLGYRVGICRLPSWVSLVSARGTLRATEMIHPSLLAVIASLRHWPILSNTSKQFAFWSFREKCVRLIFARLREDQRILICKNQFCIIKILQNKRANSINSRLQLPRFCSNVVWIFFDWVSAWESPIYSAFVSLFRLLDFHQVFSLISGLTCCR